MTSSPDSGPSSPEADAPPPIRDNAVLDSHLRAFLEDGYPHFDSFMRELQNYVDEMAPDVNLALFHVIGGFMHHLNVNVLFHDLDCVTASGAAVNSVMGDPRIALRVQEMMEGTIVDMVRHHTE